MANGPNLSVHPDVPDKLLKRYRQADLLAVDTELQGLRLYRDQVCLVQLADREGEVCLIRPRPPEAPPNLKALLEDAGLTKVFHYALTDVSFLRVSLGIQVAPYRCTKVMSKLVRTYANTHGLKDLVWELVGTHLEKENQQSNWARPDLSQQQLKYAANDVLHLIPVYQGLKEMLEARGHLPSGVSALRLNEMCQAHLPTLVELVLNHYGTRDDGWDTDVFTH